MAPIRYGLFIITSQHLQYLEDVKAKSWWQYLILPTINTNNSKLVSRQWHGSLITFSSICINSSHHADSCLIHYYCYLKAFHWEFQYKEKGVTFQRILLKRIHIWVKNSHRLGPLAAEFCLVNGEFSDLRYLMNTL